MDKNTEDALVFTVAFAMMGTKERKKWKPTSRKEDAPRFNLARRIVRQIHLSNWLVTRGAPTAGRTMRRIAIRAAMFEVIGSGAGFDATY